MDDRAVERKREREMRVMEQMIGLWCHGEHGSAKGELCDGCRELRDYALERTRRCPRMAVKTFCSACDIRCYNKAMGDRVREAMRYSGPRMIFHHPVLAVGHLADTLRAKRNAG